MTTELDTNNTDQAGDRDVVYASYNGVAVWQSPQRPLVKIATANRTDALRVVAREDTWLQVTMPDGTTGYVQSAAVTAAAYVPPAVPQPDKASSALRVTPAPGATAAPRVTPQPATPAPSPAPPTAATAAACPSCGRALADDAAFCAGCGAARPAPAMARDITCASCGRTNDAGAAFCSGCGRGLARGAGPVSATGTHAFAGAGQVAAKPVVATQPQVPRPAVQHAPAPAGVAAPQYAPTVAGAGGGANAQFTMPSQIAHPEFLGFVLCNLILAVASVMPWEDWGLGTRSGLDVNRGWLVLIGALVAGGMAGWAAVQPSGVPFLRWAQAGSGIVGMGMAFLELSLIGDAKGDCEAADVFFCAAPDPGIGVIVALLAGNALFALALFRNPTKRSFVLCFVLGVVGAGIEWVLRQNDQKAAPAQP